MKIVWPLILSLAVCSNTGYAQDDDGKDGSLSDKKYAEKLCRTWAVDDEVHPDELQQYLEQCIAEILTEDEPELVDENNAS